MNKRDVERFVEYTAKVAVENALRGFVEAIVKPNPENDLHKKIIENVNEALFWKTMPIMRNPFDGPEEDYSTDEEILEHIKTGMTWEDLVKRNGALRDYNPDEHTDEMNKFYLKKLMKELKEKTPD